MTTQINVTVDSGGLLERSRQQQAANRQAFVEGEQRTSAEQTGTEQRQKRLTAEGRNADGDFLLGRQPKLERYRQEPAANRQGSNPLAGLAWSFSRLKEQPTIFYSRATSDGPCESFPNIGGGRLGWYTKLTSQGKIYSGDGSAQYTFDYGYDLTNVWSAPAEEGQDMSTGIFGDNPAGTWTGGVPSIASFGPTNPAFPDVNPLGSGNSKTTSFSIWLPTGKGNLIYYFYHKVQTATQKATTQAWANCELLESTSSAIFTNLYNVENPQLTTDITEICLLVTKTSVQQITPPEALRTLLLSCFPSYEIASYPRLLSAGVYEGVYTENFEYPGYIWTTTPATNSLSALTSSKNALYEAVSLPGTPDTNYYVTTGGIYETLVAAEGFNYDRIKNKAPTIRSIADAAGFGAAATWGGIYDNSTAFKHSATKSGRVPAITMSSNRLDRPTDVLTYTSPEGFVLTSSWGMQAAIAYNWADPNYCSQQLQALGFSPS